MILVTGSTGLVGSHLLVQLCKGNEPVRALYRKNSNLKLVKELFIYYFGEKDAEVNFNKINWVEGDILDVVSLEDVLHDIQYVYHCAALVSFNKRDYEKLMKINVEGTANVVNACIDAQIKKLIYVSSTAAVGKDENKLLAENDKWERYDDISNYSISKFLAEQEVWRGIEEGLNAAIVNPCVILGPHDWTKGSTVAFYNVYKGLKYYTDGENAVVDVRVVANAMILLMASDITKERYLIISENISIKNLLTKIANAFGTKPPQKSAGRFMVNIARMAEAIRCRITGALPRITKETTNAAFKHFSYSNKKFKNLFPDFEMGNADDAIKNSVDFFRKNKM